MVDSHRSTFPRGNHGGAAERAAELRAIFEREGNRRLIERHDRDFPSRFLVRLLMKEARPWKLGAGLLSRRRSFPRGIPRRHISATIVPHHGASARTRRREKA